MDEWGDVCLFSRRKAVVKNVEKIEVLTAETAVMKTSLGRLAAEGSELLLDGFHEERGEVVLSGQINAVYYLNEQNDEKKKGVLSKLLK